MGTVCGRDLQWVCSAGWHRLLRLLTPGILFAALVILVACPVAFAQPAGVAPSPGPVWSWGSNGYGQLGTGNENSSDVPIAGPSEGFSDISAGGYHALAVDSNGDVWSWGQDTYGQLGDGPASGTPVSSAYPTDITQAATTSSSPPTGAAIGPVQQVAAGGYFSLALDDNGNVWAWGYNNADQLGVTTPSQEPWPTQVGGISNVVQVAAGQQFSLALRSDGTVWAWGVNAQGQLGNGLTANSATPQEVWAPGSSSCTGSTGVGCLSNVIAIAAAGWAGYALEANGTVVSWGRGAEGELGNGTTVTTQDVPVQVSGLSGITAIAGGGYHALAVGGGGAVWAWGDDSNGQLGNNSTTTSSTPVQVEGLNGSGSLSGVQSVAAGGYYSLALTDSGSVYAWGQNASGQLGNGNTTDQHFPVEVTNIGENGGAASISAGEGTLSNQSFIIGQPAISLSTSQVEFAPGQVGQSSPSVAVTLSDTGDAPLALNFTGMVGQDSDSFQISGDSCSGTTLLPVGTAAADLTSCTIGLRQSPVVAGPLTASLQISQNLASLYTYLPLSGAGLPAPTSGLAFSTSPASIFATGSDSNGQLGGPNGGGAFVKTAVGVQPSALSFVQVSAGGTHSLGLRPDGTVWAWGGNSSGQLGNDSNTDSWTLAQVPLPGAAVAVSAGGSHSLAIEQGGTVWAWGSNADGQLGNGTTTSSSEPAPVPGLSNVVAVSAGGTHSLALEANGTVWAWGNDASGQLGNDGTTNASTPQEVCATGSTGGTCSAGYLSNVIAISAGGSHSLALTSSGTIYAWGLGSLGQLGNGTTTTSDVPVQVSGITTAVAIATGNSHSLALLANGTVDAWGLGTSGQLGQGTTNSSDTPVSVTGLPSNITQIAGGYAHSLAMTATGQVYAWGLDSTGQLGNGNTTNQDTATQMTSVANGGAALGSGSQGNHTLFVAQPYASPSATTLMFSSESPGQDSSALTETITNNGLAPLVIGQDSIVGADGDQFKNTGDGCAGITVAPGGTCTIGVRYEALVTGTPAATLRITSNSPTSPTLITLDPPAPKATVDRKLSCHTTKSTKQSVTLSCTSTPKFSKTGTGTVRVLLRSKILLQTTARIHNHQLNIKLNINQTSKKTYTLVIHASGGTGHIRVHR
jgi:alpha-tubulin suppressor-like RCC1 family protein